MKLNYTLRNHLPKDLPSPPNATEEWYQVALAQANCTRRIKLAYSDDILGEVEFAITVSDLLKSMAAGSFNGLKLKQYLELGLIIPRYRVRHYLKEGGARVAPAFMVVSDLSYDANGYLQDLHLNEPLSYYRKAGLLIENPQPPWRATKAELRSSPLFTFSQVGQVLEIYRNTHFTLDLLNLSPEEYEDLRNDVLSSLKARLIEIGLPRFCARSECMKPLPPDSKRLYCSKHCQQKSLNTRKPKSTPRVARSYVRRRPFESFAEAPPFPPVIE